MCDYKAKRKAHLHIHMETVHFGVIIFCDKCDYKTSQKSHLTRHNNLKHAPNLFFCTKCCYKANSLDKLDNHVKKHKKLITHKCKYCTKIFHQRNAMARHLN